MGVSIGLSLYRWMVDFMEKPKIIWMIYIVTIGVPLFQETSVHHGDSSTGYSLN